MFRFNLILLMCVSFVSGLPSKLSEDKPVKEKCCLDSKSKPSFPLEQANYNCRDLTPHGSERCNQLYGGDVCKWNTGKKCQSKACRRISKYELHYGKYVDVGKCSGICKNTNLSCSPLTYSSYMVNDVNSVQIIDKCKCDTCSTDDSTSVIEIKTNKCVGNCNEQKNNICLAGINDNFNSNNLEPSEPSTALLSGILSSCSAGVQSGFDIFIDNRCFGHTFTNCFSQGECPLRAANLHICMRAAMVSLTQTDSLILGINGNGLWSMGLPALNGGNWNPNDELCIDLNLNNIFNSGTSILNDIQMAGHLDVVVQDDSAVDFLELSLQYDKCQRCVPKFTTLSHLYTGTIVKDYVNHEDCDCVQIGDCNRVNHFVTYFEGTMFEQTVNVGQCLGKCSNNLKCTPIRAKKEIKAPEGSRTIGIIEKCDCKKIPWNPKGQYV
jgi:hypothetical protein